MTDDALKNLIARVRDDFRSSYTYTLPYWSDIQRWVDMYNRKLDREKWDKLSEIVFPLSYIAVEQAMPFLMQYLMPTMWDEQFLEVMPQDDRISSKQADKIAKLLQYTMFRKMRIAERGYSTIKDCVKAGVGFGIVEKQVISPPVLNYDRLQKNGKTLDIVPRIGRGVLEVVETYRHIPIGQIVPSPDGSTPNECTVVFFIDYLRADEIIKMYQEDRTKIEPVLQGDPDKIIAQAKQNHYDASLFPSHQIIAELAGRKNSIITDLTRGTGNNIPVIPVIKAYYKEEQVWLANGETLMFHLKDSVELMLNPIVKASSSPASDVFFTPGIVAAGEDVDRGANMFFNALFDMLTDTLSPAIIKNMDMMDANSKIDRRPFAEIEVFGDARQAIQVMQKNQFPAGLFPIGDLLVKNAAEARGQSLSLQGQGTPGMVRGGKNALETLMQTSTGREKALGAIIKTGWLEPVADLVLLSMQSTINETGRSFSRKDDTSKTGFKKETVTLEEIRNVYDISIDTSSRLKNSAAEAQLRLAQFSNVLKGNPLYDQQQVAEWAIGGNTREIQKMRATEEQIQQNMQIQQGPQQQGQPGQTPAEQAIAGGASQQAGLPV